MTKIDAATMRAYIETEYRVLEGNSCILKIGAFSPELHEMHNIRGVTCSAFVTACNPFSSILDAGENAARMTALSKELAQHSVEFISGIGQHPSNSWPGEESFLIFGLGLEEAKCLGERLGQNGIVWSGADAVPALILLR